VTLTTVENRPYDAAIAGAGILGLAHAYHLARRGLRVVVFERGRRAAGASVRNFGMLWPIGQPAGRPRRLALRSLEVWFEVLRESGLWHAPCGSLHLAYREDEAQVLREFAAAAAAEDFACRLIGPAEVRERSPAVKTPELILGLWSAHEAGVDPREVIAGLPDWLARRHGVEFHFGTAVSGYDRPALLAGGREWRAERLFVCTGDDLETLYPAVFAGSGLFRVKLQMLRSEAHGTSFRLGPHLAAGLTLRHYGSFASCPSLPALKARFARELPEYERFGIHVMASQNGRGEVTIGDSHESGDAIEPFDKEAIDALILRYLDGFLDLPGLRIAERWHGVYVKHAREPVFIARPAPGATVVTGTGGAGMTLSFGIAEEVVREELA
jgi:FAD dependent oxidoreductase TIGR03364